MLSVSILCKQPLSSARTKSSNIVFIRHKFVTFMQYVDFIKHKCSFKAIIIIALNSPLSCPSGRHGLYPLMGSNPCWLEYDRIRVSLVICV